MHEVDVILQHRSIVNSWHSTGRCNLSTFREVTRSHLYSTSSKMLKYNVSYIFYFPSPVSCVTDVIILGWSFYFRSVKCLILWVVSQWQPVKCKGVISGTDVPGLQCLNEYYYSLDCLLFNRLHLLNVLILFLEHVETLRCNSLMPRHRLPSFRYRKYEIMRSRTRVPENTTVQ